MKQTNLKALRGLFLCLYYLRTCGLQKLLVWAITTFLEAYVGTLRHLHHTRVSARIRTREYDILRNVSSILLRPHLVAVRIHES